MVAFISTIVVGSFFYNNGENLLHDLILIRLEVEDGEMAGNNRVTEDFDTDFEKLCESSAVIFGKSAKTPSLVTPATRSSFMKTESSVQC